jgi:predicted nucleic acid-binding protein
MATWMRAQSPRSLFTASICQAEILAGVAVLPTGRRRAEFEAMARAIFTREFDGRILPFDTQAASAYPKIFANRRQMGRPIETADLIVSATARAHDAAVVTRDSGGFEGCGLMMINPWDS